MEKLEYIHYLNRISVSIGDILEATNKLSQENFIKNMEVKERTYFMLQEIGQYADEIVNHLQLDEKENNLLTVLKSLKTARYNLQSEINDQVVFGIIKNDLENVQQTINQKLLELQTESSMI